MQMSGRQGAPAAGAPICPRAGALIVARPGARAALSQLARADMEIGRLIKRAPERARRALANRRPARAPRARPPRSFVSARLTGERVGQLASRSGGHVCAA